MRSDFFIADGYQYPEPLSFKIRLCRLLIAYLSRACRKTAYYLRLTFHIGRRYNTYMKQTHASWIGPVVTCLMR